MVNSQTRFYVVPKIAIFNFKRLRKNNYTYKSQQMHFQFSSKSLAEKSGR